MNEPILHHYPTSPFAEKVRLMLGFKQLAWRSVLIPLVMPKPDVVALTGGYRKTPVLQIGADVYCDTALIARVLEARQPDPTLYPAHAPLAVPLAQWADGTLFAAAVSWAMQPAGVTAILGTQPPEVLKAFAADRAAMRANAPRPTLADATAQLKQHLSAIAAQLRQGGPWLFGEAPCIADFSVGHCLWFIRLAQPVAHLLNDYPPIGPWLDRLFAIGHCSATEMSSAEALGVAASAGTHAPTIVEPGLGFEAGQAVTVAATDYGIDPVAGTLVGLSLNESVLSRSDARAGTVHVHFPRFGFHIKADKT
jgi:glutathione S-transferase